MSRLTTRLTAMLLSGMLVMGLVSGSVFASEMNADPSQITEMAAEGTTAGEEQTHVAEIPADSLEASEESASEEMSDVPEEEVAEYYTVTLDANGGCFANEWDDVLGETVESAEVLNKNIPIGEAVVDFPVREQENAIITFMGWSLERDGERVSQGYEEYAPVENCVLYAVWQVEETTDAIDSEDSSWGKSDVTENQDMDSVDENTEQADLGQEFDGTQLAKEAEASQEIENTKIIEELEEAQEYNSTEPAAETDTSPECDNTEIIEALDDSQEFDINEPTKESDTVTGHTIDDESGVKQYEEVASGIIVVDKSPLIEEAAGSETYSEDKAMGAIASGTVGNDLNWIVCEDGRLIISGTWGKNDTERPWSKYSFNKVIIESGITRIGSNAFLDCSEVTNVTIPNTVTSIDFQAFRGCKNLTEVALPSSLTEIGSWVFYSCTGLERVTFSEGLTSIGEKAFYGCTKLKSVALPNGLVTIDSASFYGCTSLTDVTIPDSVTSIGSSAFYGCTSLSKVKLPDKLNTIEYSTFNGCTSLKDVQIPDSLTSIGGYVFCGCTGLEEVRLPDSMTDIGSNSFMNCTGLTNITIPTGVTTIKMDTFAGCTSLTLVEIPGSVTMIESWAFRGCTRLPEVVIPDGVKIIAYKTFDGCSSLNTIYFKGSAPSIDSTAFKGVTATAYYLASDPTWTEKIRQNYGGTIKWVPVGMDDALILSPSELVGYVYTDDDWYSYANELGGAVKYFCNDNNFWHVKVISDYDSSAGGVASDFFANFINGKEGWKELLTDDISEEVAEEILLALLNENRKDIANLAEEKTSTECQNILIKTFDYYLQLNAFDVYKRNKLIEYMSSDQFETTLRTKGFEKSLEMALGKLDDVDESRVQEIISGFKESKALQIGLDSLDIGLYVGDKVMAGVDEYCKIAQIQAANELYTEMLENVRDNSNNDAVKKAAEKILKIQGESEKEAMEQFLLETAGDVADDIIIKALDEYSDQIWFLQAAKYGFSSGSYLANKWFHSDDINKQKRVMRISADVGNALSTWVTELSDGSTTSKNDFSKAEKAVCGLDMLATVRLNGENALKTMSSHLLFNAGEEESARAVHMVEEQINSIKVLRTHHLELLKVACPVDIEVYSSNGSLIATIYDGTETRGKSGDVSYTVYYSEISDDYVKIISVPEDQGYYYRIKGIDTGYTSFDLSRLDDEGTMRCAFKKSVSSDDNTIIEVLPSNNLGDTPYKISKDNVNSTSGSLTVREDRRIPVTGISTGTTRCEITDDQKYAVSYEILPANAVNQYVNWKSSNENVAMVGSNGVIVGISPGTATVTGTTDDGGYSISIDVVVNSNPIASGTCGDNLTWTLTKGGTLRITGTGEMNNYYNDTTYARAPWYSDLETIKSVAIGKGVTNIGFGAFEGCSNLKSVTIPNSVTTIKGSAFKNCDNLTNVTIPNSVTSIGTMAFTGCTNLTKINVDSDNAIYSSADGALLNKDHTELICCPSGKKGVYSVPDGVVRIGTFALSGCSGLTGVEIPETVTSIPDDAFDDCPDNMVIRGVAGSYAQQYADTHNITFITIDNPSDRYSVKFDANGGDINSEIDDVTGKEAVNAESITKRINKDEFVFIPSKHVQNNNDSLLLFGWSLTPGGQPVISFNESYQPDGDCTLYAVWKRGQPAGTRLYGDANDNDIIDMGDTVRINRHIQAKKDSSVRSKHPDWIVTGYDYEAADINRDGVISSADVGLAYQSISAQNSEDVQKEHSDWLLTETFVVYSFDDIEPRLVTGITLNNSKMVLEKGKSDTLTADIIPANADDQSVEWSSNNEGVATVDSTGNVTAISEGKAIVTATACDGSGQYAACEVTVTTPIFSITKATVTGIKNKTYTGKALTQIPVVKIGSTTLKLNTDYKLTYKNNTNAGTATVTISGINHYKGIISKTFTICKAVQPITAKVKASSIDVGKTTTVSITGNKGKKSYKSSNTAIATVNSSGKVTAKKVGTVKITATSAATANYKAASKIVTINIRPKPTTISKLVPSKGAITVKWKKQASQTSGYQIQYSSRSDFKTQKTVKLSGAGKASKKISGLARKHKYYVRVRPYKTVGSKSYFSTWSAAKTVKTK